MDSSTHMNMTRLTTTLALTIALFTGCSEAIDPELQPIDVMTYPVVEGSVEAVGLLDLVNHASTTFEVLDDEVPLDRRAAGNIIAHRDGGDPYQQRDPSPVEQPGEDVPAEGVGPQQED